MGDHDSKQYACTDLGNVERFVEQHRHHLKATGHKSAWFYWDGCRWKQTGERKAHSLAVKTVQSIVKEAEACRDHRNYDEIRKWAKQSQSESRISALFSGPRMRSFMPTQLPSIRTNLVLIRNWPCLAYWRRWRSAQTGEAFHEDDTSFLGQRGEVPPV